MLDLEWNKMALYPAGYFSRGITFAAERDAAAGLAVRQRAGDAPSQSGGTTTFKPVPFNTLVDSPIYAGQYFKRVDLTPAGGAPVHLDIVADAPKYLEMTPEQLNVHRALVTQATTLFGSHHYDHYDFLFSLSDELGGNGLEHHQSSENGVGADYFTAWKDAAPGRDLLAHEYTHSWNGKFRRGADLWTPNFNVPMGDSLLWVYEGQTQYWGFVLTARAGMWTPQQFRDALAMVAANYDRNREGFQWRTLEDTTNDPTAAHRTGLPYRSWQMSEEYYSAGQMMWLEVDAKLRAAHPRPQVAGRFRQGLLRRRQRQLRDPDLHLRRRGRGAGRRGEVRLGGLPARARRCARSAAAATASRAPAGSWSTPTRKAPTRSSTTAGRNRRATCTTSPGRSA